MTKILNREEVKRIVGRQPVAAGGGGGGDFDPTVLNGYATELWVDENYISIEFFSRLFQAHGTENGQQTDIDPNDMDSTITSIESMFGFWTDYYLSALGNGGGLGSTLYLSTLADVLISSPANNQVLTYNATIGKWVNANPQAGVTDLASLTDVTITSVLDGQVLLYNTQSTKWINSALKTINGQSILGSGDISVGGGASGNYLPLTGGTLTNSTTSTLLNINAVNQSETLIAFRINNTVYSSVGYAYGLSYIARETYPNYSRLGITDAGEPEYWKVYNGSQRFPLLHSGNYNNYALPLTGGTLSGILTVNAYIDVLNIVYFRRYDTTDWAGYVGRGSGSANDIMLVGINNKVLISGTSITISGTMTDTFGRTIATATDSSFIGFGGGNSGNTNIYGNQILFCNSSGSSVKMTIDSSSNVGIGTAPSYKLHVDGTIYATGAVTALSDIRKKDVLSTDIGLTVEQIADAPTIKFLWKDRRNEGIQVGSVAQFWAANLPEVVMDKGGELSMQYGVAALVSAIITARKVVDHERRISELEKENERLKTEVEQLRLN